MRENNNITFMLSIASLKPGVNIVLNDVPYQVVQASHSKQARGGGIQKTVLKNILTGENINHTFQGNDRIEEADITFLRAQYLYRDNEKAYFMDSGTFDQFDLPLRAVEESMPYLKEGSDVDVRYFRGTPININLKIKVKLKVKHTEPGVKGNSATAATKLAVLETGLEIQVPLFINKGDILLVDTRTGSYIERV